MNDKSLPSAIFLMGPTASGKTDVAVALLQHYPVEIISVDSALVYQEMNIGTAKPDRKTLEIAPHHLVNIISPIETYSAAHFRQDALDLMADICHRGKIPLLVGGTMLYFKALEEGLSGLPEANPAVRATLDMQAADIGWPGMHQKLAKIDPEAAVRLQPNDMQRIQRALEVYEITGETMTSLYSKQRNVSLPYHVHKFALIPSDRKALHARIAVRFERMIQDGFIDEVKNLLLKFPNLTEDSTSMRCVGYRQALMYLDGKYELNELLNRGIFATRQLAKRQLTWLRSMQDIEIIDSLDSMYIEKIKNNINHIFKTKC